MAQSPLADPTPYGSKTMAGVKRSSAREKDAAFKRLENRTGGTVGVAQQGGSPHDGSRKRFSGHPLPGQ